MKIAVRKDANTKYKFEVQSSSLEISHKLVLARFSFPYPSTTYLSTPNYSDVSTYSEAGCCSKNNSHPQSFAPGTQG